MGLDDRQLAIKLDNLSIDILGLIVVHLVNTIGTPQIKNQEDIPVIIKYIKNIALTNKPLYDKIQNIMAGPIIINAISQRFNIDRLTVAGMLKSPGAKCWIQRYLNESGEYKSFKDLQKIFQVAHEVRSEFSAKGFKVRDGQKGCPGGNPYRGQTKNGFFLVIDCIPGGLMTPWGKVDLNTGGCGIGYLFEAFIQSFCKRFTLAFVPPEKNNPKYKYYTLINDDIYELYNKTKSDNLQTKIPLTYEQVMKLSGTNTIVITNYPTTYKILAVDGYPLPDPEIRPDNREYYISKQIWSMLQDQYDQETNVSKIESQPAAIKMHEDRPQVVSRLITLENLIPECSKILEQLNNQPIFEGFGAICERSKILLLESYQDCQLISLLCEASRRVLGDERSWYVHEFGSENILYDKNKVRLKYGITLWIVDRNAHRCSLTELTQAMDNVLSQIKTGWLYASLIEYSDIMHKKSAEEWHLLIKKKAFQLESKLIYSLAKLSNVNNYLSINNTWLKNTKDFELRDTMYLWIKKSHYQKIINQLGIVINNSTEPMNIDQ